MPTFNVLRAAALTAAVLGLAAVAARADDCEGMTTGVKALIDKFDPAAKGGNNDAKLCSAFAEGLGLIKAFRVVTDECLDEGDERTKSLADIDRRIRALQGQIDKSCE